MIGLSALAGLERALNVQKNQNGLTLGRLKLQERSDATEPISAHIDPSDWSIAITLQKGYAPVRDEASSLYVQAKQIRDPLEKICQDLLLHECGHWELPRTSGYGCPFDTHHHDLIVEAVSQELTRFGKESFAGYIANAFEDVLDNLNCRIHTDHAGQVLFWNEQGLTHGPYTKFYEAFVRLNICLWGDITDNKLLSRWYTKDTASQQAISQVRSEWSVPSYDAPRTTAVITARRNYLFDKSSWPDRARSFSRAMAPLLDEPQPHRLFGAATQAPSAGSPKDQKGSSAPLPGTKPIDPSAFDKKLASKEGKEEAAHARYTAGLGPATNRESYEQFDSLYRKLASIIPIETHAINQSFTHPLVPYGRVEFDPERHDPATHSIQLGLSPQGTVGLQVNAGWITTKEGYKRNLSKHPRLVVLKIDTSDSMKHAPDCDMSEDGECTKAGSRMFIPWGDHSKLHFAYLGVYGIDNYLEQQRIKPFTDSAVINFSTTSIAGKGAHYTRTLLTPQFGGTTIDPELVKKLTKDGAVLISLSDGDVQNWHRIKEAYKKVITAPYVEVAHVHIGPANGFSQDLQSWGIPVSYVMGGMDLAGTMVKTATSQYRKHWRSIA